MYAYEPQKKQCERCGANALEVLALVRILKMCTPLKTPECKRNAPHTECSPYLDMELACEACFTDFDPKKYLFLTQDHERLMKLLVERKLVETLEKAREYLLTGKWLLEVP